MGKRVMALALAGAMGLSVAGATPAFAGGAGVQNEDDVIVEGACSGASDWKVKLSEENGALEVEFEVDQNVVGDTWKVTLTRNGVQFFRGRGTTVAPSGSFEIRRVISDGAGADTVQAVAKNPATGEVCRGSATSDF